jgi:hypothetical protein
MSGDQLDDKFLVGTSLPTWATGGLVLICVYRRTITYWRPKSVGRYLLLVWMCGYRVATEDWR